VSDQSVSTPHPKRGRLGKILIALAAIAVLLVGGYLGALAFYAPQENMLASWGQTLDVALAKTRPVLVKAGSKW
jgi:hypothetical protein